MMNKIFKHLSQIDVFKTIFVNLYYLPFPYAIKMPIFIYKRTKFKKLKGKILIEGRVRTGQFLFGFHTLGIKDAKYSRTILEHYGTLIINGRASIGRGSKLYIGPNAELKIGDNFTVTGNSEILCQKEIKIEKNCLLSWDCLIMDTDFHHISDESGKIINSPRPILIGDNVWIGSRSVILKGVAIADNNVIAANSLITKNIKESKCVISGHGKHIEIIKRNINWTP